MINDWVTFPHLFVDSNVLYKDYRLSTNKYKKLISYKKYTKREIYMSEVVVEELIQQYKEAVLWTKWYDESLKTLNNTLISLNSLIYNSELLINIDDSKTSEQDLVEWYDFFLKFKLKQDWIIILPNEFNKDKFDKVVNKVIKWLKPCKRKSTTDGSWFKDALIRESYLLLLQQNSDQIAFISSNKNDFWTEDWNRLNEVLISETWRVNIEYYTEVQLVRNKYISDIESFMDVDNIKDKLEIWKIEELLKEELNNKIEVDIYSNENIIVDERIQVTWIINLYNFSNIWIKNMTKLYVKLEITIEFEFEFESYIKENQEWAKWIPITDTAIAKWIVTLELNKSTNEITTSNEPIIIENNVIKFDNICKSAKNKLEHDKNRY